jgi:hypothetical protein
MILSYGGYSHQIDEAGIVISKSRITDIVGNVIGQKETWSITGQIHASNPGQLTSSIKSLEKAYEKSFGDVTLTDEVYGKTAHSIKSTDTNSGVIVKSFSFPDGEGAEYTTFRKYEVTLEATYDLNNTDGLIEYNETFTSQGTGGQQFVVRVPRYGAPIYQRVARATPIFVQQSGTALGYKEYPIAPLPLYPQYEHLERRQISQLTPSILSPYGDSKRREFRVNWNYYFTLVR